MQLDPRTGRHTALLALLLLIAFHSGTSFAEASDSFSTSAAIPEPPPPGVPKRYRIGLIDGSLYTSIIAYRTLDFFSSQPCLHSHFCAEGQLPALVVETKPTFITFEAAMAFGEIGTSLWMHHHGRGKMARAIDLFSVSTGASVVHHNYAVPKYH